MATTPVLNDNHSSDYNNRDVSNTIIHSASLSPVILHAETDTAHTQSTSNNTDAAPDGKLKTFLPEGPALSTPQNITDKSNNNEYSIKLKRCKHGRIKIKDPSKKKHVQQSDRDANITVDSTTEANNDRIKTGRFLIDDNNDKEKFSDSDIPSKNDPPHKRPSRVSNHSTSGTLHTSTSTDNRSELRTSEFDVLDQAIKSGLKDYNQTSRRDERNSCSSNRNRSRSRSRSGTPKKSSKWDSPHRRSRRSSSSPERSSSRGLSRGFRHRRCSPSPSSRRRGSSSPRLRASPGVRPRPKRKKRGGRKNRNKRRRSLERRKLSETYRRYRRSPYSRSPSSSLRSSRSRSMTPTRRSRRELSRSVSVEKSNNDRYSAELRHSVSETIFDKLSQRRPMNGERLEPTVTLQKQEQKNSNPKPPTDNSSKPGLAAPVIPANTTMTQQRVPPSGPNYLPRLAQADPDPMENISARTPTTPSNGGSAPGDVYDPEEPILPLSPVDSQPVVEKTDDDVPSSAVQLNQQEKYLQKFHRQERVVEEVKIALRPFYQNRTIDKEQYKDVLRKAVPKICHSKDGEISPVKIRSLVDAYVRKMQK